MSYKNIRHNNLNAMIQKLKNWKKTEDKFGKKRIKQFERLIDEIIGLRKLTGDMLELSGMTYKGFVGVIKIEDNILYGNVVGIKDVITFQSNSIKDIENEFHESVDTYLEFCKDCKNNDAKK